MNLPRESVLVSNDLESRLMYEVSWCVTHTAAPFTGMAEEKKNAQPEVVWNDSNMKSLYVNATNVVGGREEIMMLLGLNQAWNMEQSKVNVEIAERVVMTPYTAKRLAIMLGATLKAYEAKFGAIDIGVPTKKAK